MFEQLSEGFRKAKRSLQGRTELTEANLEPALEIVRKNLLDADVDYGVTKDFLESVKSKLLGREVQLKAGKGAQRQQVRPEDHFIATCQKQLEEMLGGEEAGKFNLSSSRPGTVMMVGLQGSGKTTSSGKLVRYLVETKKKSKPLLVAADVYRPAAREQLKILGSKLGIDVFSGDSDNDPVSICTKAMRLAEKEHYDLVVFDTAGRLAIDEPLMNELSLIKKQVQPDQILFVCDAMMGQDAVTTAKSFNDRLDVSGIVLTKMDGDSRGGAALSIKKVTGKPVRFVGTGEDLKMLESFRPEGLASRILGLGDVVGLMEDFERVVEEDQEEQAERMLRGEFSLTDFYKQISMIQKMGSMKDIAAKLPLGAMLGDAAGAAASKFDDNQLVRFKSIIDSMTPTERLKPAMINPSRAKRIAGGSGRTSGDVNQLIKMFTQMKKVMQLLSSNTGLLGKIPGLGQIAQMKGMADIAKAGGIDAISGMDAPSRREAGVFGGLGKPVFDREKQKQLQRLAKQSKKKRK